MYTVVTMVTVVTMSGPKWNTFQKLTKSVLLLRQRKQQRMIDSLLWKLEKDDIEIVVPGYEDSDPQTAEVLTEVRDLSME